MSQRNIHGLRDLTNEAVVEVIRRKFLLESDTNPLLYHPIDVDRCRTEGWQIERFFLEKGTPEEALRALVKAMQWKKTIGVHERPRNHFPVEFVKIFGHQKPSRDKEGTLCVWGHSTVFRKIHDFDELIRQYSVYHYEKRDREAGNRGFINVTNSKGVSYSNMDMSLAKFSAALMEYYPLGVKFACTLDMPSLLVPILKGYRSLLSKNARERVGVCKSEELTKYVDIDVNEIPVSIGGKREVIYDMIDDMLPLCQCKHLGITDKQIDKFYSVYNFERD